MKVSYFISVAVIFTASLLSAQEDRLGGMFSITAGSFMPEVDDSVDVMDGTGGALEFSLGGETSFGLYFGGSIFHGAADIDTMGEDGTYILESDIYSSGIFFDVKYDFLSIGRVGRRRPISLIAGLGVGIVNNALGPVAIDSSNNALDGEYEENDNTDVAFRLTLMFRINFSRRFNGFVTYQHLDLGEAISGETYTFDSGGTTTIPGGVETDVVADVLAIGVVFRF